MGADFDFALFEAEVKKSFGDEAITDLDAQVAFGKPGTYIPTSADTLNAALGCGGIPRGRIIEIYGMESGGKSTLALDIIANAQRMFPDKPVFYVDSENAMNKVHANQIGVKTSKPHFYMAQTAECEEALDLTYKAAKYGASVCVVDSVAALSLKSDMEDDDTTETRVAGISKALRAHLRRIAPILTETLTTAIYINHITFKPGVAYGNPETTPGGKGLPFFASQRLDVRQMAKSVDKKTGEFTGIRSKVKIVKNKVAPPFRVAEYDIIFGEGIDRVGGLIDAAVEAGVIAKTGGWLKFGEDKFNGKDAMREKLLAAPKLEATIRAAFIKAMS
jgi:recombination protein RecA